MWVCAVFTAILILAQAESVDAKQGYYDTWRALANMQRPGTYLYDNLRNLADVLQNTEKDVCHHVTAELFGEGINAAGFRTLICAKASSFPAPRVCGCFWR
jgi:hypothetical protein